MAVAACGRGQGQPPRNVVGSLGTPGVEAQFAPSAPTQTVTGFEDSHDGQMVLLRDGASGFDLKPATRVLTVYFPPNSATSKRRAAQQALEQTGYFSSVTVLPSG